MRVPYFSLGATMVGQPVAMSVSAFLICAGLGKPTLYIGLGQRRHQIGGNHAALFQVVKAHGLGVTLQIQQLAFVGVQVLLPQTGSVRTWRVSVDRLQIHTCNRAAGRVHDLNSGDILVLIAPAQGVEIPHQGNWRVALAEGCGRGNRAAQAAGSFATFAKNSRPGAALSSEPPFANAAAQIACSAWLAAVGSPPSAIRPFVFRLQQVGPILGDVLDDIGVDGKRHAAVVVTVSKSRRHL